MTTEAPHTCSFCSKSADQVQYLIAGPGSVYICDECIDLRRKILEGDGVVFPLHPNQDTSSLPPPPYSCSFCGKPQDQVQRLVAGPGGVFVCSECTNVHRKILEEGGVLFPPHTDQNTSSLPQTPHSCSFCSKQQDQVQRLIAGPGGFFICGECVGLRMEMLREEMGKGRR